MALFAIAALAWAYLATGAGMDAHPMGAGGPEGMAGQASGATFLVLFGMWAVMMVAMMLPGAAPMILLYGAVAPEAESSRSVSATSVFASGYLIVWTAFGLGAAAVQLVLHRALLLTPALHTASAVAGGAILVVAGLYQLTPLKHACLRRCRSPVQFLTEHWRPGAAGALRMGLAHGLYCVGCCWTLMALLFVGGVMNLVWVAAIALVVVAEKLAPSGHRLARFAGVALIAWGAAVIGRAVA